MRFGFLKTPPVTAGGRFESAGPPFRAEAERSRKMTATLTELDAKQEKAIAALLSHPTVPAAARACGSSEATLFRYLRDDNFKAHYRRALAEVVGHAISRLQNDCSAAAKALREICVSKEAPASARVAAAKAILDWAVKAVELQDMDERLEGLEAALAEERERGEVLRGEKFN